MTNPNLELRAQPQDFGRGIAFLIQERIGHRRMVGTAITVQALEEGEPVAAPTFSLTNGQAQLLMDDLWRAGIRPSGSDGTGGHLAAVERHLEDQRQLAARLLDTVLEDHSLLRRPPMLFDPSTAPIEL